jgi:hypothetical protein
MIKKLLKCFLLIALPQITYSQPVELVVEVFSHYEIKAGKVTDNKRVFEENFYNPDNQFIQQLIFNDSLPQIDKFTFLFYSKNNLISKETHDFKDSVIEVTRYKYSADNKLTEENLYNRQASSSISLFEVIRYKYSDSLLSEKTILDKKLKVLQKTSYSRNNDFDFETSTFKNMNKPGDLKKREAKTFYSKGKKDKVLVSTEGYDGKKETQTLVYSYGKKDSYSAEKITFLSLNGDTLQVKESRYTVDGKKVSEALFDKSGNYISYTGIERNPHKMNLGKPQMYKLK